jgi:hypothetical protein
MAWKRDPATGQMVDDGQPAAPGAVPPAAPATGVPAIPALFPPKPEHERTVTSEQRSEGELTQSANARAAVAEGAVLNANEATADLERQEAAVREKAADDKATLIEAQRKREADAEADRVRLVAEHKAADDQEIEQVRKAKVAAGAARADYWKGNASGEVLAAVLRGIDRAASSFRGETGPTGVDRILEAKIADHERKLVGEWEASKEAQDLKRADRAAFEREHDRRRIQAANQSMLELQLLDVRADKALAALGPQRSATARQEKDAAFKMARAALEQQRAAGYDNVTKVTETNRSPTGASGSNKPLSADTQALMVGAEQYAALANRNMRIIEENGGEIPVRGPLAEEFEKNDTKMAAILQKPLGKSEDDAKTARKLQGTPGVKEHIKGKLGISDPVANYKKALEVNTRTIVEEANKTAALEGTPAAASPRVAPPAAAAAPAPVREYTEKGTGRKFKGRKMPDGSIEEI